jgi:hypothetical protein
MKTKNFGSFLKIAVILLILSVSLVQCSSSKKSVSLTNADVSEMINNKSFTFVAEQVNPLRGRSRQLTSEYDVTLKNDSLVSYLPYFGRAYQAPMDPSKGGIQFTSTNFTYSANPNKKGSWIVNIIPKDYQAVQQMTFTIFENGNASLNVTSTSKDPISFNGHVRRNKK